MFLCPSAAITIFYLIAIGLIAYIWLATLLLDTNSITATSPGYHSARFPLILLVGFSPTLVIHAISFFYTVGSPRFQYVPCVPNVLITVNYDIAQIPALTAAPDTIESIVVAITFTRRNQPGSQVANILDETLPIPLLRNTHAMGSIRHVVRRKHSTGFRGGLAGTSHDFILAETTVLGPNPYEFFPRPNSTASLLVLPGIDTSELRTISDIQDSSIWTAMSNIGGIVTIGGIIFSTLFGLGCAAPLGLEDVSFFPSSQKRTQDGDDEENEKEHMEAGATDSDGSGVGESGARRRNAHDVEGEKAIPPLPLSRRNIV
ncbi:hypothetical protein BOTBODRAFT_193161 [Botryobasidium botryosum FD-172 SS1]|uniref:Uncharacterized protein n=1 Tax=Botryobasidium botryosum (strain FD-172 SS1) TaxID=930990 RepID=A0A067LSJ3_BOTB1|nr:hypothetical protein BOTBODRAFT_193161 [Botryobasidium botryosum FD-172 SS1]